MYMTSLRFLDILGTREPPGVHGQTQVLQRRGNDLPLNARPFHSVEDKHDMLLLLLQERLSSNTSQNIW
jgi:hypothetical protein